MREKNVALKSTLFERSISQRELSTKTGIAESLISLAIHGRYILDNDQKKKIAEVLGKPVQELFDLGR